MSATLIFGIVGWTVFLSWAAAMLYVNRVEQKKQFIKFDAEYRICRNCMSLQGRGHIRLFGKWRLGDWRILTPHEKNCKCSNYAIAYETPTYGSPQARQDKYPTYMDFLQGEVGEYVFTRFTGVAEDRYYEVYHVGDKYPKHAYRYTTFVKLLRNGAITEKPKGGKAEI